MTLNYKEIKIGELLRARVKENAMDISRICKFMKCTEGEIKEMFLQNTLSTDMLLKWSKLLEYDFFRIYTQHLILYSPPAATYNTTEISKLPRFKKNIYTQEIIDFILEQIESKEMTKSEVIEKYRIPKATLYKWINKHHF